MKTNGQKRIKQAGREAGARKRVNRHTWRHRFATHLLVSSREIPTILGLTGHTGFSTAMINTHVIKLDAEVY